MFVEKSDPETEERLFFHLDSGDVCFYPCDTIYGLIGVAPQSLSKIRKLKNRPSDAPFIEYAYSVKQIERETGERVESKLAEYWPGPLSLILNNQTQDRSVAYRIPDDPLLLRYLSSRECTLFTTSANAHGEESITSCREAETYFKKKISLYIYDSKCEGREIPSTLIDGTSSPVRVLREGAVKVDLSEDHL